MSVSAPNPCAILQGIFEELYEELPRLEQFMGAIIGLSRINFEAFRGGLQMEYSGNSSTLFPT
jgi:hypothetical protein